MEKVKNKVGGNMNPKLEKCILMMLILLFGILNIGVAITTTTLMLDFNKLVKEQLIEIVIIILIASFINYALLSLYKDGGE